MLHFTLQKNIFITLLLILPMYVNAQLQFNWAKSFGSENSDNTGPGRIDHDDNLYLMSSINGPADLDPGPGQDILIPIAQKNNVLSKFDANGNFLWASRFRGGEGTYALLLEVKYNQVQVICWFTDSLLYVLHGVTEFSLQRTGNHVCMLTLNLDGNIIQSHDFPAPPEVYFNSYYTLPDRRIIVSGSFFDTLTFDPNSLVRLVSKGSSDGFLALLNPDKSLVWAKSYGSTGYDLIAPIAYQPSGIIYFAVEHEDTLTLQAKTGTTTLPAGPKSNSFFGTFSLDGGLPQIFALEASKEHDIRAIDADADGNIYVVGLHDGTINFAHPSQAPYLHTDLHQGEGYIAKYNADGLLQWVRTYTNSKYGSVHNVYVKRGNELYVAGVVGGRADLDPGPDSLIVTADYQIDGFIAKYDLNGNQLWVAYFPGEFTSAFRNINVSTESSRVILNGYTYGTVDCDPGDETYLVTTNGGANAVIISFDEKNVITSSEPLLNAELYVYPNPTSDKIILVSDDRIKEITIFHMDGRQVYRNTGKDNQEIELDITHLPSGLYLVSILTGNNIRTARIVKE